MSAKSIATSAAVAACLLSLSAQAKTIDIRKSTDADGKVREISFCSRPSPDKPGLPGHAFIAFAETPKSGAITFRAVGHTVFSAKEAILSYGGLIDATGALVNEKYTSVKQQCLTLQVNKADYDASYSLASQPLSNIGVKFDETKPVQKSYSLGADDCVGFMVAQAQQFSSAITVPARKSNELPLPYIRRLIDAN